LRYSLDRYRWLMQSLKDAGRPIRSFADADAPGLIVRIDVDYDLGWAAQVAAVNAALGVRATFFVQVASGLYNLWTAPNRQAVASIVGAGQRIGLHYTHEGPSLDAGRLGEEFAALSRLAPTAERIVAWHNPPEGDLSALNAAAGEAGFVSTYGEAFFRPDRYVSDSNCKKTPKEILDFAADADAPVVQVLLHPLNWVLGGDTMDQVIRKTFAAKFDQIADLFQMNSCWTGGAGRRILEQVRACPWYSHRP